MGGPPWWARAGKARDDGSGKGGITVYFTFTFVNKSSCLQLLLLYCILYTNCKSRLHIWTEWLREFTLSEPALAAQHSSSIRVKQSVLNVIKLYHMKYWHDFSSDTNLLMSFKL